MKHSRLLYTPAIVRFILAIVVSLVSLCVMAQQGQGQDVNANTGQAASSSTQGPVKANAQEPSTVVPAASPGVGTLTGPQPTPTSSGQENDKLKGHSIEAVVIAGLMIVVLGLLFVLQLYWSRRLDQTTYLGQVFHDSVLEFERGRLTAPLREKWERGIYLQEEVIKSSPPQIEPELAELDRYYGWGELRYAREAIMNQLLRLGERTEGGTANPYLTSSVGNLRPPPGLPDNRRPTGWTPPPRQNEETTEQIKEKDPDKIEKAKKEEALRSDYKNKAAVFQRKLEEWAEQIRKEARQKYDNDQEKAKNDAETNTGSVIDTTEMSLLRGQGPKFVLEFTALIVIIFLAVILGVLGRLDAQQIGTLLAAIAGYVLGKATTSQAPAQASAQVPALPAPKAEGQRRTAGKAA